jgi:hypothetical protein
MNFAKTVKIMKVHIYNELIKEIAQELDMGRKCFYHIPTGGPGILS